MKKNNSAHAFNISYFAHLNPHTSKGFGVRIGEAY